MAAIFVSQNNETAAMFVSQTSPVGVELFSYVNAFFCSNKFAMKTTCYYYQPIKEMFLLKVIKRCMQRDDISRYGICWC